MDPQGLAGSTPAKLEARPWAVHRLLELDAPIPKELFDKQRETIMVPHDVRIEQLLQRIQGEFREMPGLRLTPAQAQRLWGLDRARCDDVLGALVDAKFLARTHDGAFVRFDASSPLRRAS
ncbi:MAG: hypothetical protein HY654_07645 [Acidobacteria bacterium]|nr:hypothetical protein [Acidobacteriota bacterium]